MRLHSPPTAPKYRLRNLDCMRKLKQHYKPNALRALEPMSTDKADIEFRHLQVIMRVEQWLP